MLHLNRIDVTLFVSFKYIVINLIHLRAAQICRDECVLIIDFPKSKINSIKPPFYLNNVHNEKDQLDQGLI
jgi:hypothetical protein